MKRKFPFSIQKENSNLCVKKEREKERKKIKVIGTVTSKKKNIQFVFRSQRKECLH